MFDTDPNKRRHLDWQERYNIIIGVTRGLLYLHEDFHLRIIHRDIKASNILLDKDLNAKISDFGLARPIEDNKSDTKEVLDDGKHKERSTIYTKDEEEAYNKEEDVDIMKELHYAYKQNIKLKK